MRTKVFLFIVLSILHLSSAKVYSRCELAKKLSATFPRDKLADWNCLVRYESSYNSKTKGKMNSNGSYDYGIFQINSKYWCGIGKEAGDCNIDCNSRFTLINLRSKFKFNFRSRISYGRHYKRH